MTGYTRNDTSNNIETGNVINASDLDGEFDAIQTAFNISTGHRHNGTSGEGAPITVIGPAQDIISDPTNLRPKTDNAYDLGTTSLEWKDLYIDGTANIDTLQVDENATITGNFTVNGNSTFGNATTDTVTVTAGVASSFVPATDDTYDLGSATKEWKDLYVDGIANIDTLTADAGTVAGADITTISNTQTLTNKTINLANNTLIATSTQLAAALTDETGTGSVVFSASPALTGTPTAPTAAADTNTTQIATTAHVFAERTNTATLTGKTINLTNNTLVATSAQLAAALTDETGSGFAVFSISPALTGTPTAPTAAADTNTTQVATTAHVFAERTNTVTLTNKTINLASNTLLATSAQLAAALSDETGTGSVVFSISPALTGTPTAPTASADTNTTQIATTAHVFAERANSATLTNKTISVDDNTVSGIAASSFVLSNASGNIDGAAAQKAIPAGVVVGTTDSQALSNKTLTSPVINGDVAFDTNTLFVDSVNNRVGLGTITPAERLDVNGNIKVADGGSVYSNGNITISADQDNDGASSVINMLVDNLEVADFNSAGYLRFNKAAFAGAGICTQTSDNVLNIGGGQNTVNDGVNFSLSGPTHVSAVAGFQFRDGATVKHRWDRTGDFFFWNTGGSERVRITSAGNVGIGTATPVTPLDVNGAVISRGVVYRNQPAQTSKAAAATLTIAELLTGIVQYTGSAATLTLPTGTDIEGGVPATFPTNMSFDFSVINTGSGAVALGTATGLTLTGSMSVAAGDSGMFRVRKTATNTYTFYRIS